MATQLTQRRRTKHSAQQYLDIAEIRDGVVILRDGSFRAILMASSVNFALKSEEEQNAIIYGFQDTLNSLDFPMQILVTSRRIDLTPYLRELDRLEDLQQSELMKIQLQEYREYIKELVKVSNVMTKNFYLVIPFAPFAATEERAMTKFLKGMRVRGGLAPLTPTEFSRYKDQLWQRVDQVSANLRGIGVRLAPLNTQEIIELFYTLYNPDTARNQHLPPVEDLDVEDIAPEALAEAPPAPEDVDRFRYLTVTPPSAEEAETQYRARRGREE